MNPDPPTDRPATVVHALTVDVEDYFQVEAFSSRVPRESWDGWPLRVEASTLRILDLFDRHGVKGTFFVLGWVARKVPRLVSVIRDRGHEIGCHSHLHRLVYALTPEEFRSDLRDATKAIEDAAGITPRIHRAPSFSITRRSLWALEVLADGGYRVDSSIFPIRHDIYGFPRFPRTPVRIDLARPSGGKAPPRDGAGDGSIVEFPPSTVRILGRNLPGPGGGYLRILPLRYCLWALRRIGEAEGRPASLYFHPWEVDPGQPRIPARWRSRFRHYTNLERTEARLETILRTFRFAPMSKVLEEFPPARAIGLEALEQLG